MRIVSGRWAGRDLASPGGRVRPTAEAVRAAWLDRLEPDLPGARLLDLFAGTGALGIEGLSRGAASCDFVEHGPAALHALRANIARFRLKGRTRLFRRDARTFAAALAEDAYDLCLADPPYGSGLAHFVVDRWLACRFSAILAVEGADGEGLPATPRGVRRECLTIGAAAVTLYR